MVEVPEVAFPSSGEADRSTTSLMRPGSPSADLNLATRERIRSGRLALSEARRASNRAGIGLVSELRCECTRPNCTETLPCVGGAHRSADQLLVAPAHLDGCVVVRAADRFFVIESRGHAIPHSREEMRPVASLDGTAGFLHADDPGYVHEAAKRGVFGHTVDGTPEEVQSAIDITLQRFSEYPSLQGVSARCACGDCALPEKLAFANDLIVELQHELRELRHEVENERAAAAWAGAAL
jgi:hypothetical protein